MRIDKDENNAGSKVSTNSKELITKRKHWKCIKFQRTIKLICCDWPQETIKYKPVNPSELAKLKYKC